jgi:hypothetical protein
MQRFSTLVRYLGVVVVAGALGTSALGGTVSDVAGPKVPPKPAPTISQAPSANSYSWGIVHF